MLGHGPLDGRDEIGTVKGVHRAIISGPGRPLKPALGMS